MATAYPPGFSGVSNPGWDFVRANVVLLRGNVLGGQVDDEGAKLVCADRTLRMTLQAFAAIATLSRRVNVPDHVFGRVFYFALLVWENNFAASGFDFNVCCDRDVFNIIRCMQVTDDELRRTLL